MVEGASSGVSLDLGTVVSDLDVSINETGGVEVFNVQSAANLINLVRKLESQKRSWVNTSAFPVD